MPDETTQNQDSKENPISVSSQEPMADISVPATDYESSNMPPEALESPKNADIPVSLK